MLSRLRGLDTIEHRSLSLDHGDPLPIVKGRSRILFLVDNNRILFICHQGDATLSGREAIVDRAFWHVRLHWFAYAVTHEFSKNNRKAKLI